MSDYFNGLNAKLLSAIPEDARCVLELGCANGRLGQAFKQRHPHTRWVGVELDPQAGQIAAQVLDEVHRVDVEAADLSAMGKDFDVVVIGDLLEHLKNPEGLLERLYDVTTANACIVCCLPNMTHLSVVRRMLSGDMSYDSAGLLDRTHTRFFSAGSAFKNFLDAGWLPSMVDQYQVAEPEDAFTQHVLAAARTLGIPQDTARSRLSCYQMIISCRKWLMQGLLNSPAMRPFSVIVPVNMAWQYELNIHRSPGLAEVGADVVVVRGAQSAAQAYEQGAAAARHPWHVIAHQDVYFPTGTGYAIASAIAARESEGAFAALMGFAGLHADTAYAGGLRKAGLVVDRTQLFDEPASQRSVSLDELAIIVHRDSPLKIDASLGWHLWATDLCLQALSRPELPAPSTLRIPLFHNSTTGYELPDAFRESADRLLERHPAIDSIATLCGMLSRAPALQ